MNIFSCHFSLSGGSPFHGGSGLRGFPFSASIPDPASPHGWAPALSPVPTWRDFTSSHTSAYLRPRGSSEDTAWDSGGPWGGDLRTFHFWHDASRRGCCSVGPAGRSKALGTGTGPYDQPSRPPCVASPGTRGFCVSELWGLPVTFL